MHLLTVNYAFNRLKKLHLNWHVGLVQIMLKTHIFSELVLQKIMPLFPTTTNLTGWLSEGEEGVGTMISEAAQGQRLFCGEL